MERTASPRTIDDFSTMLKPLSEGMWEYGKDSSNGCLISEASLKEMLKYLSNVTFSIISPVLPEKGLSLNVERLASFRTSVQEAGIPLYHIVGQWLGEGSDTDCVDKGYILIKPDYMSKESFLGFLQQALQTYDQNSFVFKSPDEDLLGVGREGEDIHKSSGNLSLNMLGKAYAYRFPNGKRFVFLGAEIPNGSIMSFRLFKGLKVEYYLPEDFFEKKINSRI